MVREMFQHGELAHWKVIFITDRTQLEDQLCQTSQGIRPLLQMPLHRFLKTSRVIGKKYTRNWKSYASISRRQVSK